MAKSFVVKRIKSLFTIFFRTCNNVPQGIKCRRKHLLFCISKIILVKLYQAFLELRLFSENVNIYKMQPCITNN